MTDLSPGEQLAQAVQEEAFRYLTALRQSPPGVKSFG
jgi:hypothetical protein